MDFSNRTVIVKFWAPWCRPCHAVAPIIKEIAATSKLDLVEIDIDIDYQTAETFGVRSIPTVIGIKSGEIVDQVVGAQSRERYQELTNKLL
jgi:thioredoxin 1